MNAEYCAAELANARTQLAVAQAAFRAIAHWTAAKREMAEQVEFWGNKVAFLSHAR